jgi:hypothetical protein
MSTSRKFTISDESFSNSEDEITEHMSKIGINGRSPLMPEKQSNDESGPDAKTVSTDVESAHPTRSSSASPDQKCLLLQESKSVESFDQPEQQPVQQNQPGKAVIERPSSVAPLASKPSSFVSFTQQKILLQRQQFLSEDASSITSGGGSANSVTLTSDPSKTANSKTKRSSQPLTSSNASSISTNNMKQRQLNRLLRDALKVQNNSLNLWWSQGVDPMKQSIERVSRELQAENQQKKPVPALSNVSTQDENLSVDSSWLKYLGFQQSQPE